MREQNIGACRLLGALLRHWEIAAWNETEDHQQLSMPRLRAGENQGPSSSTRDSAEAESVVAELPSDYYAQTRAPDALLHNGKKSGEASRQQEALASGLHGDGPAVLAARLLQFSLSLYRVRLGIVREICRRRPAAMGLVGTGICLIPN